MNSEKLDKKPLILLGAGCHAKVVLSLVKLLGLELLGVCDPILVEKGLKHWRGFEVLGAGKKNLPFAQDAVDLVNGIGQRVGDTVREKVFQHFKAQGYYFPALKHPFTAVDETVILGEGVQVMAGAVIQADTRIGTNVIINTQVSVDHDCIIDDHVHIAPGAVLCGNVQVGRGSFIASGVTLIQRVIIGNDSVIAAGLAVARDVGDNQLVMPGRSGRIQKVFRE